MRTRVSDRYLLFRMSLYVLENVLLLVGPDCTFAVGELVRNSPSDLSVPRIPAVEASPGGELPWFCWRCELACGFFSNI